MEEAKRLDGAEPQVYWERDGVRLRLHVFRPTAADASQGRAAIVFFFGGGWHGGGVEQFAPHCRYFASRGMAACAAEYRIGRVHGVTPFECMADARSAVRWTRMHAKDLGIEPDRIVASGGSAGGHIAACAAIVPEPEPKSGVSPVPDALVLFNPVLDTTLSPRLAERFGGRQRQASPLHHVRAGLPPAIVFHGRADETVPYESIVRFAEAYRQAGNRCELVPFEGMGHGFFNYGRSDGAAYHETVRKADEFLASLGFLSGRPAL